MKLFIEFQDDIKIPTQGVFGEGELKTVNIATLLIHVEKFYFSDEANFLVVIPVQKSDGERINHWYLDLKNIKQFFVVGEYE